MITFPHQYVSVLHSLFVQMHEKNNGSFLSLSTLSVLQCYRIYTNENNHQRGVLIDWAAVQVRGDGDRVGGGGPVRAAPPQRGRVGALRCAALRCAACVRALFKCGVPLRYWCEFYGIAQR